MALNLFHSLINKKKLYCPICNKTFKRFIDYKAQYYLKGDLLDHFTKNSICPNCGSDIRHRLLVTFLINYTKLMQDKLKVLHFAPEPGIFNFLKNKSNLEYVTCDIAPSAAYNSIKIDITNISFPDKSFDVILCVHVLEHIQKALDPIRETACIVRCLLDNSTSRRAEDGQESQEAFSRV